MDYEEWALIVTDMQNDFADPRGSLYVRGGEEIVSFVNGQIEGARARKAMVVYTQDWHPPSTPHFQKDGGVWPVHCVQESWGAAIHPALQAEGEIVKKGSGGEDGYSGFSVRDPVSGEKAATRLEPLLRDGGVRRVVLVGIATDYCVKETALDAKRLGFEVVVLGDGIRAVDLQPGDGERAIEEMIAAGARVE